MRLSCPHLAAIRRGLLDSFYGRRTADAWRVNPTVPIPADTMRPGLEGTGPAIDLGMAMGALNSGASQWMWDWEDAGGDYKDQHYRAWQNLADILAHKWDGKPFVHPTKGRTYTIDVPPEQWPTIFHRVPGLHLRSRQISLAGLQCRRLFPRWSFTRSITSTRRSGMEQPESDRTVILDGLFGDRQDLLVRLASAGDPAGRARIEKALQAYDYVYDVPHAPAPAV